MGGSAFDPNGNRLILNAQEIGGIIRLHEIPVGFSNRNAYVEHCASCHGIDREGTDDGPSLVDVGLRLTRGQLARVMREGSGRMPSYDHLQDFERNARFHRFGHGRDRLASPIGRLRRNGRTGTWRGELRRTGGNRVGPDLHRRHSGQEVPGLLTSGTGKCCGKLSYPPQDSRHRQSTAWMANSMW
ncbi:MAG: cytochrome c [Acidobacteria bacterium]|nr:cytochrome c [Acidobacteriota bacterium]MYJ04493.1 cytochrome c [Acidobacteriota bacterium]